MTTVIVTVVVLGILVLVHEAGHFTMARLVGVQVDEFAVGFGPKLYGRKTGETEYTVRAFPLGGFVRMAGMDPALEESEKPPPGRGFLDKSILDRAAVFVAGPGMNFVAAILLFFLVFSVIGIDTATLVVDQLQPGLPAQQAGLQPGDQVLTVNGQKINDWPQLVQVIQDNPGKTLAFHVKRNEQTVDLQITPVRQQDTGQGFIGMVPVFERVRLSPGAALARGVEITGAIVGNFVTALTQLFRGQQGPEFIGVVGIGAQIGEATRLGLANLIFFAGLLSASFGLINLLPIPALDGSHLLFLLVEKIRGRRVDPDKENLIHFVGFALLMLLAIFITYRDILRLI